MFGRRHSRTTAVWLPAGPARQQDLPQLCPRPRRLCHPLPSPHRHPHRHPHYRRHLLRHHRPHCHRQPHLVRWILSTVRWTCGTSGPQTRRSGAAGSTTSVMETRQCHRRRLTHSTASQDLRIGRPAGQWTRRHGAAGFTARAATLAVADVSQSRPPLLHLIAMQDSRTGWPVGRSAKKPGAARMPARDARTKEEDVCDSRLVFFHMA